jgi:predicted flap endonuclease-1-like 5' DNA nuclease
MYLMGLRAVRLDGRPMSIWCSCVRFVGMMLAILPLGLGYLWVLGDDRRQAWQDKLAGTCILYAWPADQNDILLQRARRLFQRGQSELRKVAERLQTDHAYELVTVSLQDLRTVDVVLDEVHDLAMAGKWTVARAGVFAKDGAGRVGEIGSSDLAQLSLGAAPLNVPALQLQEMLADAPGDTFVVALMLEQEEANRLAKAIAARPGRTLSQYPLGAVETQADLTAALDEMLHGPGAADIGTPAVASETAASETAVSETAVSETAVSETAVSETAASETAASETAVNEAAARLFAGVVAAEQPEPVPPTSEPVVAPDVTPEANKESRLSAQEEEPTLLADFPAALSTGEELPTQLPDEGEDLRKAAATWTALRQQAPAAAQLVEQIAVLPPAKRAAADAALAAQVLPRFVERLQDLAAVYGIGQTYERRLYRGGVGTFWEVAHIDDAGFDLFLAANELQRAVLDYAALRADARRLADETGTVGWLWQGEPPDDFEPIQGIGPVYEQRLYDAGIYTYRSLAASTPEQLAAICGSRSPASPDYASWIEQARLLVDRGTRTVT